MAYEKVDCIVLRSANYRDADKIYTLYSRQEGKISAAGRGVRKVSSKRSGSLDTFNYIKMDYFATPNGHRTITELSHQKSFRHLKNSSPRTSVAYKLVSYILKNVSEEAPDPNLFHALLKSLNLLDTPGISPEAVVSYFRIRLMQSLGYGLVLHKCVLCSLPLSGSWDRCGFSLDRGGLVCPQCITREKDLSVKTAAFFVKVSRMRPEDHKYFHKDSFYLTKISHLLEEYVSYSLDRQ
jgi:DNA repair protein RecO (recombination protein O)